MKSIARVFSVLFVLALAVGTLRADADTVTLKDGRVLKGQIVEERSATVVMLVGGSQRSFGRDFIAKIAYGDGSDAGGGQASAPPEGNDAVDQPGGPATTVPAVPGEDLLTALSVRYRVPVSDVAWVRAQGVPDADLPLVFMVAATARVAPRRVVKLYLEGLSWDQIEASFQMQPDDIYYQSDDGVDYPYYYDPELYGWDDWGGYGLGWAYGGGWGGNYGRGRGFGGGYHGGGYHGGGGSWGGGGRTPVGGGRGSFASGSGGRTPLAGAASVSGGGGGAFHGGGGGGGFHGGGHN
jgi:hypothetical protein